MSLLGFLLLAAAGVALWQLRRARRRAGRAVSCVSCRSQSVQVTGAWVHCRACGFTQDEARPADALEAADMTRPADAQRSFW